jgi:hypothetical protein
MIENGDIGTAGRSIWQESIHQYWRNRLLVLTIIALMILVYVFDEIRGGRTGGYVSTIVMIPLAISIYGTVIDGRNNPQAWSASFVPLLWRSFVLDFPAFVLALTAVLLTYEYFPSLGDLSILFSGAAYVLAATIILSLWGTWLPAVVAEQGNRSLSEATRRGKTTFKFTLGRMLACRSLELLSLVLAFVAIIASQHLGFNVETSRWNYSGGLAICATTTIIIVFMNTMQNVILARAYLIAEGALPGE